MELPGVGHCPQVGSQREGRVVRHGGGWRHTMLRQGGTSAPSGLANHTACRSLSQDEAPDLVNPLMLDFIHRHTEGEAPAGSTAAAQGAGAAA